MNKLILLRHGESIWNKENRFTGWTDVPLSEKGRDEARRAGELLRSFSGGTYPCGPLSGTAVLETCSEPLRWLCDHVPVHSL